MVKKIVKLTSSTKILTLENVIGILLAILIIFDLKVEEPICNLINTNMGKLLSVIVAVLLFVVIHPIVGILFIIYIYQCFMSVMPSRQNETNKAAVLEKLNPPTELQVEEEIILNRAPIKNKDLHNNVEFTPYAKNVGSPF